MKWKSDFISWVPQKWGGIEYLKVAPDDVWTPDITLYQDIDDNQLAGKKSTTKV